MIASAVSVLARLAAGPTVVYRNGAPDARQRIYFANHTSHLDFVVLWSALPAPARQRARPVAAKDYWERGAIRRFLASRVFRAVLIDRPSQTGGAGASEGRVAAARQAIDALVAAMSGGDSLIVFPEGTRGSGETVAPFRSGLYHLCLARPGVEALPVYLDNMNRILPKGESLPVPMLSRVVFGDPIAPAPGEAKEAFLERARGAVVALGGP
jgi:1-acyl-sn-glycerol-3-phosphate acyltransferase